MIDPRTNPSHSIDEVVENARVREKKTWWLVWLWLIGAAGFSAFLTIVINRFGDSQAKISDLKTELADRSLQLSAQISSANQQVNAANVELVRARAELNSLHKLSETTATILGKTTNMLEQIQEQIKESEIAVKSAVDRADSTVKLLQSLDSNVHELQDKIATNAKKADDIAESLTKNANELDRRISVVENRTRSLDDLTNRSETVLQAAIGSQKGKLPESIREKGKSLLENGDYENAILEFTKGLDANPQEKEASSLFLLRGLAKNSARRYKEAAEDYSRAIALQPSNDSAYAARAANHFQSDEPREAIIDYNKAIELNPKNYSALIERGDVKRLLTQWNGAIQDYTYAIEGDPKLARAFCGRGKAKLALALYREAILDFDKAVSINPAYADAYDARGRAKEKLLNYNDALADFTRAREIAPNSPVPLRNRAYAKASSGDLEGALKDAEKAVELDKNWASSYNARGLIYLRLNNYTNADSDFKIAASLVKGPIEKAGFLENIGLIYISKMEWQEALNHAEYVETVSDTATWNKVVLVIAAQKLGKNDIVANAMDRWLKVRTADSAKELKNCLPEELYSYVDGKIP